MAKILLTRPKKLSQEIAKTLHHQTIIQPLFSVHKINLPKENFQNLQAVLITSQNAVFALEKLSIKKDILILAVGEKTALALRKLGYQNVICANNSALSLLNLAIQKLSKNNGLVLYLSGSIITLDLAEKLHEQGFEAKKIVVYKTKETEDFSKKTIDEMSNGNISEVWIYSKNSEKIFYKLARKHNLLECLKKIKILYKSGNQ